MEKKIKTRVFFIENDSNISAADIKERIEKLEIDGQSYPAAKARTGSPAIYNLKISAVVPKEFYESNRPQTQDPIPVTLHLNGGQSVNAQLVPDLLDLRAKKLILVMIVK